MERKKKYISSNSMYFFYIKKDTSHEFEREMCLIYNLFEYKKTASKAETSWGR